MDGASSALNKLFASGSVPSLFHSDTASKTNASTTHASTTDASATPQSCTTATSSDKDADTEVDRDVAPAVEHETVKRQHETREQTVVEKERHQDHYITTVQPLKDREVQETDHDYEQAETQYRNVDHNANNEAKQHHEEQQAGFHDEHVEENSETKTNEGEVVGAEHVHHHLHETVQPVIEKGMFNAPLG